MSKRAGVCICGQAVAVHYDRLNRYIDCYEVQRRAQAQVEAYQAGVVDSPVVPAFEPWGEIERRPVSSSNLASLGYALPDVADPAHGILDVEFANGSVYRYLGVPASVYEALLAAPSVGSRFQALVKAAGYPCEQLRAPRSKP